jgi:hypothetical protein
MVTMSGCKNVSWNVVGGMICDSRSALLSVRRFIFFTASCFCHRAVALLRIITAFIGILNLCCRNYTNKPLMCLLLKLLPLVCGPTMTGWSQGFHESRPSCPHCHLLRPDAKHSVNNLFLVGAFFPSLRPYITTERIERGWGLRKRSPVCSSYE